MILVCPSDIGWYAEDMLSVVLLRRNSSRQNLLKNTLSLSETSFFGMPCRRTMLSAKKLATETVVYVFGKLPR